VKAPAEMGLKLPDGRDRVARDRADVAAEEKIRFTSSILPKSARRTKSLDALLPFLYLRGVSTGDFQEVLGALSGKHAPNI
jgi:putative transposase